MVAKGLQEKYIKNMTNKKGNKTDLLVQHFNHADSHEEQDHKQNGWHNYYDQMN